MSVLHRALALVLLVSLLLAACGSAEPVDSPATGTSGLTDAPTPTGTQWVPVQPTATPVSPTATFVQPTATPVPPTVTLVPPTDTVPPTPTPLPAPATVAPPTRTPRSTSTPCLLYTSDAADDTSEV